MFTIKRTTEPTKLDEMIVEAQNQMLGTEIGTEEYAIKLERLTALYKLKEIETPKRVNPDTLALIAGNLTGIIMVLGYEHAHVVTSKAFGFIGKLGR